MSNDFTRYLDSCVGLLNDCGDYDLLSDTQLIATLGAADSLEEHCLARGQGELAAKYADRYQSLRLELRRRARAGMSM